MLSSFNITESKKEKKHEKEEYHLNNTKKCSGIRSFVSNGVSDTKTDEKNLKFPLQTDPDVRTKSMNTPVLLLFSLYLR